MIGWLAGVIAAGAVGAAKSAGVFRRPAPPIRHPRPWPGPTPTPINPLPQMSFSWLFIGFIGGTPSTYHAIAGRPQPTGPFSSAIGEGVSGPVEFADGPTLICTDAQGNVWQLQLPACTYPGTYRYEGGTPHTNVQNTSVACPDGTSMMVYAGYDNVNNPAITIQWSGLDRSGAMQRWTINFGCAMEIVTQ